MINIPLLVKTYLQIAIAEKKQRELDAMSAEIINYGIIRDLVNSAAHGVVISVTFKDGTKLDIKRTDEFDKLQKSYTEAF